MCNKLNITSEEAKEEVKQLRAEIAKIRVI